MKLCRIYQPNSLIYGEGMQYICPYLCNKLRPNTRYFSLAYKANKLSDIWEEALDTKTLIKWEEMYKDTLVPLKGD